MEDAGVLGENHESDPCLYFYGDLNVWPLPTVFPESIGGLPEGGYAGCCGRILGVRGA